MAKTHPDTGALFNDYIEWMARNKRSQSLNKFIWGTYLEHSPSPQDRIHALALAYRVTPATHTQMREKTKDQIGVLFVEQKQDLTPMARRDVAEVAYRTVESLLATFRTIRIYGEGPNEFVNSVKAMRRTRVSSSFRIPVITPLS